MSVMKNSATGTAPLTIHRLDASSPVPLLGGSYRWVLKRDDRIVGYFGSRKEAEAFVALSKTYRAAR